MTAQFTDVWTILGEVFRVNPLLVAAWWLSAIVLACVLVYAWRRLFNS